MTLSLEEVNKLFADATSLLNKEGLIVMTKPSRRGDRFLRMHPESLEMTWHDEQAKIVFLYTSTKSKSDPTGVVLTTLSKSTIEPTSAQQIANWAKKILDEYQLARSKAKKNIKSRAEAKFNRVKLAEALEELGASQASSFDTAVAQKIFELSKWFIDNDQDIFVNYTREDD